MTVSNSRDIYEGTNTANTDKFCGVAGLEPAQGDIVISRSGIIHTKRRECPVCGTLCNYNGSSHSRPQAAVPRLCRSRNPPGCGEHDSLTIGGLGVREWGIGPNLLSPWHQREHGHPPRVDEGARLLPGACSRRPRSRSHPQGEILPEAWRWQTHLNSLSADCEKVEASCHISLLDMEIAEAVALRREVPLHAKQDLSCDLDGCRLNGFWDEVA